MGRGDCAKVGLRHVLEALRIVIPHSDNSAPFSIRSLVTGDVIVLEVAGEVDMTTSVEIAGAVELVPEGTSRLIVDFSEVTFVDSTGLNVLISSRRALASLGIEFQVVVPDDAAIRRVFEITQLADTLHVVAER